jgi:hypothetical protein
MAGTPTSNSYDPNLELQPIKLQIGVLVFTVVAVLVVAFIILGKG